jgi:ribosomal protein S27E
MTIDPPEPADIIPFPGKKRPPDEGRMLEVVHYDGGCAHLNTTFRFREGETEVTCGACGTKLDPMFVLKQLATEESRWFNNRDRYQDEMKRIEERSKTECEHCGKMTRISRAKARPTR